MPRFVTRALMVFSCSCLFLPLSAVEPQGDPIKLMSWLAGCWESSRTDRRVEEQWMRPDGGTMLGMSRTVAGNKTSEFEFMQILSQEGKLIFTAKPSGQAEDSFTSTRLTSSEIVFENPQHDFPQRIIYRLNPDGSLSARIEGTQNGETRGVDLPMRRAKCPEGAAR
jgi:Domain of unknown function (DUF6265)